jgi:hypothetical protein
LSQRIFFYINEKKKEYSEWNMLGMQIKWAGVARPIVHLIPNHWPSFPLRYGHMIGPWTNQQDQQNSSSTAGNITGRPATG